MLHRDVFSTRLKRVRKAAGEQQAELALAIGLGQAGISAMENGRQGTTLDNLAAICQHYNISADYFLGLIDEPRPLKKEGET